MEYTSKFNPKRDQRRRQPNTSTLTLREDRSLRLNLPFERHQQVESPEPKSIPYFQSNRPHQERQGRSVSPIKWQKKVRQREERLSKITNILEDITQRHSHMKNRIEQLRKEKECMEQDQMLKCSFHPQLHHNPRYMVTSTMEERHKSWDTERAKHFTSIRQEVTEQECKECTFQPNLVDSKPISTRLLKKKQQKHKISEHQRQIEADRAFTLVQRVQPHVQSVNQDKPGKNNFNFKDAQTMIRYAMTRIPFDY